MMVLLDMDGVIANFFLAAVRAHGAEPLLPVWPRGQWDMASTLQLSQREFWQPIDSYDFWFYDVKPFPEVRGFLNYLKENGHQVVPCSVPSGNRAACTQAKRDWLDYHFPEFHLAGTAKFAKDGRGKLAFMRPGAVLIDDNANTIREFRNFKRQAILMPSTTNSLDPDLRFDSANYQPVIQQLTRLTFAPQ